MEIKSVSNEENLIEIKKSKFYTYLFAVFNENEIQEALAKIGREHKDASHICFAYILAKPATQKCSDAGEPSGTAGLPILNVIKNQHLSNVLIIVVRYFGGVKLGAGGLTRAYSNSAVEVLKKAKIMIYNEYHCYLVKTKIENKRIAEKFLHNYALFSTSFNEINEGKICFEVGLKDDNGDINMLKNNFDCEMIDLGIKLISEGENGKNN